MNMLDQELQEMDELLTKVADNTTNSTRFMMLKERAERALYSPLSHIFASFHVTKADIINNNNNVFCGRGKLNPDNIS